MSNMSSFEEALRRQEGQNIEQKAAFDDRRRAADGAVPRVVQMLQAFARTLNERGVPPQRFQVKDRHGLRPAQHSPAGYAVSGRQEYLFPAKRKGGWVRYLSLVTPDGRLWRYDQGEAPYRPAEIGFVEITSDLLLAGDQALMFASLHPDGTVGRTARDDSQPTPLEDLLAIRAQELMRENGRR